ncbi:M14 family metallocarboxypeptidase [Rheinheimera sp. 4Y26]|uniref:M14 family metallopeptidase n=1 Tax=Rheinheimera sp. 4Y26 TaxID=2977811 RepID=UPI0021B0D25E|nr:M14 family metallocarboxypeptidase [Rheinheimera sp. 4Y26]MCT6698076.1 M14 family metallocarboxypeptidase [Rheinheimera sp. 4Y26]
MTTEHPLYAIGTPGQPWGDAEKALWLSQQQQKRSYQQDVVTPLTQLFAEKTALAEQAELFQYGSLDYQGLGLGSYPLYAVASKNWQADKTTVLVTGGVHGYETSGVHGALAFIRDQFAQYQPHFNLLILPCISPWGYETINRWNPLAVDPNRSFIANSPSQEAAAAMALVVSKAPQVLVHVDLHETTDSDNSEFRPAKAARDGVVNTNWNIPDGFYLVGDSDNPQPEFQQAIIQAVAKVTHIAQADENGCLIGEKLQQFGVVNYPKKALGLCGGMTNALYVTTTEVYPDSPKASPAQCNLAQVTTICAALDFVLNRA